MKLMLQGALLLVVHGKVALESVVLGGTNIRGLTKGTSMMIFVGHNSQNILQEKGNEDSTKQEIRKFRVKFASSKGKCAEEQKNSCVAVLKDFMIIHDTDNETADIASSLKFTPIQQIALEILKMDKQNKLPGFDGLDNVLKEDGLLERVVNSCLLDPNFPLLVKRVEGTLMKKGAK